MALWLRCQDLTYLVVGVDQQHGDDGHHGNDVNQHHAAASPSARQRTHRSDCETDRQTVRTTAQAVHYVSRPRDLRPTERLHADVSSWRSAENAIILYADMNHVPRSFPTDTLTVDGCDVREWALLTNWFEFDLSHELGCSRRLANRMMFT